MGHLMFPTIQPYHTEFVKVSELHSLYVEQSGNPKGVPVVFLHGGPGSGTNPIQRRFFDPTFYRIILFDQRGAGKSTPHGELRDNTVAALVKDIETIRKHLAINKWLVFGGSWGSTLSIAYGIAHPQPCLGFILRGVFLMRETELQWFFNQVHYFFPELWYPLMQKLGHPSPENLSCYEIMDLIQEVLDSGNQKRIEEVLYAFGHFEASIMTLLPKDLPNLSPALVEQIAKIEHHFFSKNRHETIDLLEKIDQVKHLPCIIVQGRYDMICPPITAYEVHQAWTGSKLVMVPKGGHSALDPAMTNALLTATEAFKHTPIIS